MPETIVFTDLDGTLLNHENYSFQNALEMVGFLKCNSIPLIIATSKTKAEILQIKQDLDIRYPFIVENGAGIFIPFDCELLKFKPKEEEWVMVAKAKSYAATRLFFNSVKNEFGLFGFGDMHIDEVVEFTGLNREHAIKSMQRDFTEPFLMDYPAKLDALRKKANNEGFDIIQGGRFYHLITQGLDKANAVDTLVKMYADYYKKDIRVIALGDSENDFSMLRYADDAVLIKKHDGTFAPIEFKGMERSSDAGAKGWNDALKGLLNV